MTARLLTQVFLISLVWVGCSHLEQNYATEAKTPLAPVEAQATPDARSKHHERQHPMGLMNLPASENRGLFESLSPERAPREESFETDLIRFKTDDQLWEKISDEDGIQAYEHREGKEQDPNRDHLAFRGEAVIPAKLVKIATILSDDQIQKEWVDSLADAKTIERANEFEDIEYNRTSIPWPFRDRDFVYKVLVQVQVDPPVLLLTMKSIEDPRMPPVKGVVRGELVYSFFYLKELPDHQSTKMVIEMSVDPKGSIPKWLAIMSQKNWPHNTLAQLRTISMRDNISVSPTIQKYFDKSEKGNK